MRIGHHCGATLKSQCPLKTLLPGDPHQRVPLDSAPFKHCFYVNIFAFVVDYNHVYVEVLGLTYHLCK